MLRKNTPAAMRRLWFFIRRRQLGGFRFRLQKSIGPYVVDFVCNEAKLVVELIADGPHREGQKSDTLRGNEKRDAYIESQGFRIMRFQSQDVYENIDGVLVSILDAVKNPPPAAPASVEDAPASQNGDDVKPN